MNRNSLFENSAISTKHYVSSNRRLISGRENDCNISNISRNEKLLTRHTHHHQKPSEIKQIKIDRIGNSDNPQNAYEYVAEVYSFYRQHEVDRRPSAELFRIQKEITPDVRSTFIDWTISIHKTLELHTDTLFSAISISDLYLSKVSIPIRDYPLLLSTSLLIAAKNEEISYPSKEDFIYLSENVFTSDDMNIMEQRIFKVLDFNVNIIHSSIFLKTYLRYANPTQELSITAHFINEMTLLTSKFIGTRPSRMAAAALCIALAIERGKDQWNSVLVNNTGYTFHQIKKLIQNIICSIQHKRSSKFQAIFEKYSPCYLYSASKKKIPTIDEF